MEEEKVKCVICDKEIPLKESFIPYGAEVYVGREFFDYERCCSRCNMLIVMPSREVYSK